MPEHIMVEFDPHRPRKHMLFSQKAANEPAETQKRLPALRIGEAFIRLYRAAV